MSSEYPDLGAKIEKELSALEKALASTRERVKKALALVENREKTLQNKKPHFDRYAELAASDPKAAEEYREKMKLNISQTRLEVARQTLVGLKEKAEQLEERKKALVTEKTRLADFVPIKEQVESSIIKREFVFDLGRAKKPDSKKTVFEGLFTPPDHSLLPLPDGIYGQTRAVDMPVEHCIVDPKRIPDSFAEEMGLADLPSGLTDFQRLKRKAQAIPKLKQLFREAEPMKRHSRRGDPIPNPRLLLVQRFSPEHNGKIIHTHFRGGGEASADRRVIQVFPSVYTALRKTLHMDRRYDLRAPQADEKTLFIAHWTAVDKQCLEEAIKRSESRFGQLISTLSIIDRELEKAKSIPETPEGKQALVNRQREFAQRNLIDPLMAVAAVRPFSLYAKALHPRLDRLINASTFHNRDRMRKAVEEALEILRVFTFQTHIEKLLAEVSAPKDLNLDSLRQKTAQAKALVSTGSAKSPGPLVALAAEKGLSQALDKFAATLDLSIPDAENSMKERRSQLRAILEKIDFPQLLKTFG